MNDDAHCSVTHLCATTLICRGPRDFSLGPTWTANWWHPLSACAIASMMGMGKRSTLQRIARLPCACIPPLLLGLANPGKRVGLCRRRRTRHVESVAELDG